MHAEQGDRIFQSSVKLGKVWLDEVGNLSEHPVDQNEQKSDCTPKKT